MKTDEEEVDNIEPAESTPAEASTDDESTSSSTGEGAPAKDSPAEGSKDAKADPKAAREKLIESLTTGKVGDDDADEAGEAESTADDTEEKPAEEAEAPKAKDDAEKKEPATEEDELDAPLPRGTKEETQARFNKLNAQRKEMKPFAEYGKSLFGFMKDSNLDPNDVGFLLDLGARLKADPVKGAEHVYGYAKAVAEKHGGKLPIETKIERQVPDELLIALDDIITDSIVDAGITAEVAKKIRAEVRKFKTAAALPVASPTPSQPPTPTPAAPIQTQQPVQPAMNPNAVQAAGRELAQVQAEYAKAMPADWAKLKPTVDKAMEKYQGTQPHQWAGFYRTEVELARAKAIKARPPTPTKALRPSNASTPNQNNPRADALAILTGRKT